MTDEEKVVLSLRGFACATSMMIPTFHLWCAAIEADATAVGASDYPGLVMRTYMRDAMLDHLLVQLRRLYDPDRGSLAGGTIAYLLDNPAVRLSLARRASGSAFDERSLDAQGLEDLLRLVQQRCAYALVKRHQDLPSDGPRFQLQVFLARRAANKRSAHMTLDDYGITKSDIRDLSVGTIIVARAIQRVHGDDMYPGRYADVDYGAYEAAARIFDHRHTSGLLTCDLEANLDMLVHRVRSGQQTVV